MRVDKEPPRIAPRKGSSPKRIQIKGYEKDRKPYTCLTQQLLALAPGLKVVNFRTRIKILKTPSIPQAVATKILQSMTLDKELLLAIGYGEKLDRPISLGEMVTIANNNGNLSIGWEVNQDTREIRVVFETTDPLLLPGATNFCSYYMSTGFFKVEKAE